MFYSFKIILHSNLIYKTKLHNTTNLQSVLYPQIIARIELIYIWVVELIFNSSIYTCILCELYWYPKLYQNILLVVGLKSRWLVKIIQPIILICRRKILSHNHLLAIVLSLKKIHFQGTTSGPVYLENMNRFKYISVDAVPTKHQDSPAIHVIFVATDNSTIRQVVFMLFRKNHIQFQNVFVSLKYTFHRGCKSVHERTVTFYLAIDKNNAILILCYEY